ncbi:MAG TPA: DUF58 domain-containing protein [Rhodanobacteraceae bacterium]|nr:DUF58 domain-containing protein [Rhodanobacteraceae bacterium]
MTLPLATLSDRALAYAERRLPALTRLRRPERLPIRLDRRRIYVLPTGFGFAFAALLFAMLLGALNYSNNPALLLTCVFAAACGASLFAGFRTMNGLALTALRAGECHAGAPLAMRLRFAESTRARPSLRLRRGEVETAFALGAGGETEISLEFATERRGWFRPGRWRLSSDYPFGLFRIWSWLNPDAEFLVYATPEMPSPPLPAGLGRDEDPVRAGIGEEQAGLRDYRVTDPPRLIAWKASARHDSLLVRDTERRSDDALVLDFDALDGLDAEARIRRLTAWVLAADAAKRDYVLSIPGDTIGPGAGSTQRRACLRALALMPAADA